MHLRCMIEITLLCLWILYSILSAPQGTTRSLLASSKSLPLLGLLKFSTSSVGRLCVCSCLERLLCLVPFGSMWSFFLVTHSGTCAPCKHLFISSASLPWMEVNFLDQKPCIPSWPGVLLLLLFTPWEFFTSALADGLSLNFEWQQVSSSLWDSSQYYGRSRQCSNLDGLHSSPFSCHFNNPLVTLPKAPITISMIVTFMFHSFSITLQGPDTYLFFFNFTFIIIIIYIKEKYHIHTLIYIYIYTYKEKDNSAKTAHHEIFSWEIH